MQNCARTAEIFTKAAGDYFRYPAVLALVVRPRYC